MVEPYSLPPEYKIKKLSKTFLESLLYNMQEIYIAEYCGGEVGRIIFADTGYKYLIYTLFGLLERFVTANVHCFDKEQEILQNNIR